MRLWFIFACLVFILQTRTAAAYPWMIREGYAQCAQCHADPSGSGLLTPYGRAQDEILLRTHYGAQDPNGEEPGPVKEFLFGTLPVELPDTLLLGGDVRGDVVRADGTRLLLPQADIYAQLKLGPLRFNASVGYMYEGAEGALVTRFPHNNLVSRSYWAGVDVGMDDELLVRVGRIALPYGLRTYENHFWIHDLARNNTDDQQQLGIAAAYNHDALRVELMGYVGNLQLDDSEAWEHGVSGYAEWSLTPTLTFGFSALAGYSDDDVQLHRVLLRGSSGLFARWVPARPWVLMAEFDGAVQLLRQPRDERVGAPHGGYAGLLQSDLVLASGLHFLVAGEVQKIPGGSMRPSLGAWAGLDWFCLPHTDVRIDAIYRSTVGQSSTVDAMTYVAQLHIYL